MNSAFVGYEELSRSRRVLSTSAAVDNTLFDYESRIHQLLITPNGKREFAPRDQV